jgi:hypothetical protein
MHGLGERGQGTREPRYDRIVVWTIVAWTVAHLLLWAALGLPDYFRCLNAPPTRYGCGWALLLPTLVFGYAQILYGLAVGLLIRKWRPPMGQGILIATGVVALLTTLMCFGGPVVR